MATTRVLAASLSSRHRTAAPAGAVAPQGSGGAAGAAARLGGTVIGVDEGGDAVISRRAGPVLVIDETGRLLLLHGAGLGHEEAAVIDGHRWWTATELESARETFYPACLPRLLRAANQASPI